MNAAPAELLHLLVDAALQPIRPRTDTSSVLRSGLIKNPLRSSDGTDASFLCPDSSRPTVGVNPVRPAKRLWRSQKNAGNYAGVGIRLQRSQLFFRRIRRLARCFRAALRSQKSRVRSGTVHQLQVQLLPFLYQPLSNDCLIFQQPSNLGGDCQWQPPRRIVSPSSALRRSGIR